MCLTIGALALIRFLYIAGLPWMHMHQATRANAAGALDMAWQQMFAWFRMTKKTKYQEMSVVQCCLSRKMRPEIAAVWRRFRTISISGKMGSNVAHDKGVEEMNNEIVRMTAPIGPRRGNITETVLKLNGIKHVEAELTRALKGISCDEDERPLSRNTTVTPNDVEMIVSCLKSRVGESFDELTSNKANKLGSDSEPVYNKWVDVQERENCEPYLREKGKLVL